MNNIDNYLEIKKIDTKYILDSILEIPNQIKQSWYEIKRIDLPDAYKKCRNIVLCGMGGSALGGRVVKSLFFDNLKTPFEIVNGYLLPEYTNKDTLVIISSYSGNTEETLENIYTSLNKNAKIFVISTGGIIADIVKKENIPGYVFNPIYNPSKQPRMGVGYSLGSIMALFNKLNIINIDDNLLDSTLNSAKTLLDDYGVLSINDNKSKDLARKFVNKIPIIISSNHLSGSAYLFKNVVNETAKTFSFSYSIPELNHHLMEGLKFPLTGKGIYQFLFLESGLYESRILKRYKITKDVLKKNFVNYSTYKLTTKSKLEQSIEIILLGMFTSYYMAILQGTNPSEIPWVDYFKDKLAK